MNQILFSQPSAVTIQGPRVLQYIDRRSDSAAYEVIGFEGAVALIDYRDVGLQAIDQLLHSGELNEFAPGFNSPAHVLMEEDSEGHLRIELHDTDVAEPTYMLWIVVGLGDQMPVYDYLIEHLVPLDDGRFALVALYKRPQPSYSSSSRNKSSSSSSSRDSRSNSSSVMRVTPTSSGLY